MPSRPDDILPTYQRGAARFAAERSRALFERAWLRRFAAALPGPQVLDLGCGTGAPLAIWLAARGLQITGVDGAPAMLARFRANLPGAATARADMRRLALGRRFDGILCWNALFHLTPRGQLATLARIAAHAAPRAALMFTSGPEAGERWGRAAGGEVYHASLSPGGYRAALNRLGFQVLRFTPEDPDCRGHSVWLARAA